MYTIETLFLLVCILKMPTRFVVDTVHAGCQYDSLGQVGVGTAIR